MTVPGDCAYHGFRLTCDTHHRIIPKANFQESTNVCDGKETSLRYYVLFFIGGEFSVDNYMQRKFRAHLCRRPLIELTILQDFKIQVSFVRKLNPLTISQIGKTISNIAPGI